MRYINISSVLLIALISFLLSCDGKQEKISVDVEIEKTYSVEDCPIFKCDKTIDSMNIKLDEIQKRLKDE